MITITLLPDQQRHSFSKGVTGLEIAAQLHPSLQEKLLGIEVDGAIWDATRPIDQDAQVRLLTWEEPNGQHIFWHSSAHLLAQAVLELYPTAKLGTGPAIDRGFYYDIDFGDTPFEGSRIKEIEKTMRRLAKKKYPYERKVVSKEEARQLFQGNRYKQEIIETLDDEEITMYQQGRFVDLCKGPHLPHTGYIRSVKITNIAGAYWRGDEEQPQLTRIYGISFPTKEQLKNYLDLLEEAKKRDHRKLGKELGYFTFSKEVGIGLPLWLPHGVFVREKLYELLRYWQDQQGYQNVITPHIGDQKLYITSGHHEKYKESSFRPITTPHPGEQFMLKPMNCPHHCAIYQATPHSYRELPVRLAEFGTVYRYEKHGELHGLTRTRSFTQDDAHIFCAPHQLKEEFNKALEMILEIFKLFGFTKFEAQISVRDSSKPEKYLGDSQAWDHAEKAIKESVQEKNVQAKVIEGEAAFYGPKLDFMVFDSLDRKWQLGTIQVDYQLPKRFDLHYIGPDNEKKQPVIIHRALLGSLERFIAILIEHTAGKLPLWIMPKQVALLTIGPAHHAYAGKVEAVLRKAGIRTLLDLREEKMTRKVRDSEVAKIPYMIILGDREVESDLLSVRKQGEGSLGQMTIDALVHHIKAQYPNHLQ